MQEQTDMRKYKAIFRITKEPYFDGIVRRIPEKEDGISVVERTSKPNLQSAMLWAEGVVLSLQRFYPSTKLVVLEEE